MVQDYNCHTVSTSNLFPRSLVVMAQLVYEATRSAFVIRRPYSEVSYEDTRVSGQRLPDITICDLAGFWKSKMASESNKIK